MSKAVASYNIILDKNGAIANWVCRGLAMNPEELGDNITLGFVADGQPLGGLVYHGFQDGSIWWTIYTIDRRWCSRKVLKFIFGLAFDMLNCRRINILVSKDNVCCLKLVKRLGFVREGFLRKYRKSGEDCYILGILKSECKWR